MNGVGGQRPPLQKTLVSIVRASILLFRFARTVEITLAFIPVRRFPEDAMEQNHRRIIAHTRAFAEVLPHQISCRIAPAKVKF